MPAYYPNVPGVWVQEIASFPPSVAQVATAIPAFLGYTKTGAEVTRIKTLLEYESIFGKANPAKFQATVADGNVSVARTDEQDNTYLMYYALSMYFRNGGGACYVVPVGKYGATPAKTDFEAGLAALELQDEPTIVVLVDAINLKKTDYYDLVQQTLRQCDKLGDRFAIFDIPREDQKTLLADVVEFRNGIGADYLSYGAAYHPFLQTSLNYQYLEDGVAVPGSLQWLSGAKGLQVKFAGAGAARVVVAANTDQAVTTFVFDATSANGTLSITTPAAGATAMDAVSAWATWTGDKGGFVLTADGDGSLKLKNGSFDLTATSQTLAWAKTANTALYNKVKAALADSRVVLPPSSAMAGIYVRVDAERGVWKAPANVSVSSVIGPVSKLSNDDQSGLNVDADSGKSINAIRDFAGNVQLN